MALKSKDKLCTAQETMSSTRTATKNQEAA